MWKKSGITFFAHDIFTIYNRFGSSYLRNYISAELDELYTENPVEIKDFSVVGRVRLRKNEEKGFYALHLLYASQCKRQNCYTLEDFPEFYNTEVKLHLPERIKSVENAVTGEKINYKTVNGKTVFGFR